MERSKLIQTSWIIYGTALFIGLIFVGFIFVETADTEAGSDGDQSYFAFSTEEISLYAGISLFSIALLMILWNRMTSPYNVAALTFVTSLFLHNLILSVTVGWVGLGAMIILMFGTLITAAMFTFIFIADRKLKNQILVEE
ncbi:hypothetical protein [Jeotgalibacillus sp. R-1-5s-1]|uniref:hypothetical protein n=1 Tax=Jeotgalibacillus sp. R-1-5s-1 TaxID=2555897 RepID=UPI00106C37FC|nr:hypothetical protein [Jeotgalibacillus sp. R-1-5s-1]TFD93580.1 hypothetical protein E2491_14155 [Jeotgalibacillus sp. R-1-5s-1]